MSRIRIFPEPAPFVAIREALGLPPPPRLYVELQQRGKKDTADSSRVFNIYNSNIGLLSTGEIEDIESLEIEIKDESAQD